MGQLLDHGLLGDEEHEGARGEADVLSLAPVGLGTAIPSTIAQVIGTDDAPLTETSGSDRSEVRTLPRPLCTSGT